MNFPEKLQGLRKSKGFTQEAFAKELNVSRRPLQNGNQGLLIRISRI